jgi:serine/threonine protein kinase
LKSRIAQEERIKRAQKQAKKPHRAILNSEYQIIPLDYQKMLNNVAANSAAKRTKEVKPLSENKIVSNLEIEVQLIMRLNHPNIIKVYQVLDSEDECLIVMDYASGGEMVEHAAKDNFLTEEEGRKYFRQLISAIDHFHLASVVHRDLKLENILLSQDKNLLITDFGLGRTFKESSDSEADVTYVYFLWYTQLCSI